MTTRVEGVTARGASANVEAASARMTAIRKRLESVELDLIYNMDETAMKSRDHVTRVLCCNCTDSHKLAVAMLGEVMRPMCFAGEKNAWPLSYFSQRSAWSDASALKRGLDELFVPEVRARTRHQVYLTMDTLGCHSSIANPHVTIIDLADERQEVRRLGRGERTAAPSPRLGTMRHPVSPQALRRRRSGGRVALYSSPLAPVGPLCRRRRHGRRRGG